MISRKSNRLPYKIIYSTNNSFFITICVDKRRCLLSIVTEDGKLKLTPTGELVSESWLSICDFVGDIILEDFVIMPNHFHGIITFIDTPYFINSGKNVDLTQIVGMFKSKSSNLIRRGKPLASHDEIPFKWQKSFYDHVIRDEKHLQRIREYIQNNPLKWHLDILNPINNEKYKQWLESKKS